MKHRSLILAAATGALAFAASCNNDSGNTTDEAVIQAKIDSAVQARMEEMQAQLAAQNDSLINAMAMMKADSMMAAAAAAGNNNTGVNRTVRTTQPTRPTTTRPATVGNGKPSMQQGQQSGTVGNGKPSMQQGQQSGTVGNGKPSMSGGN